MKTMTTTALFGAIALAASAQASECHKKHHVQTHHKSCNSHHVVTAEHKKSGPKDIVDTAVAAGSFNTLAAALKAADLIHALKGDGPFTVFAPTDEAFAKLPKGTVEELLKPENKDKLVNILTYHVVSGEVKSLTAASLKQATALNKKDISIGITNNTITLNDRAQVVKADIVTSNGVIHVIDNVILPPAN